MEEIGVLLCWFFFVFFFTPGTKCNCHIFPLKPEQQEWAGICQAASSHNFSKYLGSDSPLSHPVTSSGSVQRKSSVTEMTLSI